MALIKAKAGFNEAAGIHRRKHAVTAVFETQTLKPLQ